MLREMNWLEFGSRYCERQEQTLEGLKGILMAQAERYPMLIGWMLLECQQLDSSRLGSLTILPYGPDNTYKDVPQRPISPRGLASDMSVAVGTLERVRFLSESRDWEMMRKARELDRIKQYGLYKMEGGAQGWKDFVK